MPTLADLRALLEMAPDGPARQRAGGTVEGMAVAYLLHRPLTLADRMQPEVAAFLGQGFDLTVLDLTDPGTAHALLTGLALALGLDPGVGALGVMWGRHSDYGRWEIVTFGGYHTVFMDRRTGHTSSRSRIRHIYAPTVANEPDPVRALALAVAHVLEMAHAHT